MVLVFDGYDGSVKLMTLLALPGKTWHGRSRLHSLAHSPLRQLRDCHKTSF
jgi:hypothetical protein